MRVSLVAKYAFASHVSGRRPIVTEGVLSSAFSRVKAAFRPTRGRRFSETNTVRLSTAGYSARTVPRFASPEALPRGLESDLLPRGTWTRSVRTSEAGVSRRGNSGMPTYESQWHERVGFIPAVNGGAFSLHFRNVDFFCLSQDDVDRYGIAGQHLSRLIRQPKLIDGYGFRDGDWETLRDTGEELWLSDPDELPTVPESMDTFYNQATDTAGRNYLNRSPVSRHVRPDTWTTTDSDVHEITSGSMRSPDRYE